MGGRTATKPRPFSPVEDDYLRTQWAQECAPMAEVCRSLKRREWAVRGRIAELGLSRDPRRATQARVQAIIEAKGQSGATSNPHPIENRDEAHWRRCLELGGFPHAWLLNGRTVHSYPNRGALR